MRLQEVWVQKAIQWACLCAQRGPDHLHCMPEDIQRRTWTSLFERRHDGHNKIQWHHLRLLWTWKYMRKAFHSYFVKTYVCVSGRLTATFSGASLSWSCVNSHELAAYPPTRNTDYTVTSVMRRNSSNFCVTLMSPFDATIWALIAVTAARNRSRSVVLT